MSYVLAGRLSHGDFPTAAFFNALGGNLALLYATFAVVNWATAELSGDAVFLNAHRWLHYQTLSGDTTEIIDVAGINAATSLTDVEVGYGVFDLTSISWLAPGSIYRIAGARYAIEDYQP